MYQADFICTYKEMDSPEDQDMLYHIQLLQAFDLKTWDDNIVKTALTELYPILQKDKSFSLILEQVSKVEALKLIIEMTPYTSQMGKDLILLTLLFQFEYFDLFHNCILDLTHKGEIREKTLNTILNTLV